MIIIKVHPISEKPKKNKQIIVQAPCQFEENVNVVKVSKSKCDDLDAKAIQI